MDKIVNLSRYQMTEEDAKGWIQWFMATGQPVHPVTARKLYSWANLPIPDHLIPPKLKYRFTDNPLLDKLERDFYMKLMPPRLAVEARQLGNSWSLMSRVVKSIEKELFGI